MEQKQLKYSKQREAIVNFLMTRKDHPTAEVVYENVRQEFPRVSLGTVYRNLSLLSELGQILKFSGNDGFDHFDYNTEPHYHFICNKCSAVIDIEIPILKNLDKEANQKFMGKIDGHTTFFYGLCPNCCKKED